MLLCILSEYVCRSIAEKYIAVSHNYGAAFGIMKGIPEVALMLSGVACVAILVVICFVRMRPMMRVGLSVMAGGALSNLGERILWGYVVDWIPVPFMDLQYNLADVEISLGALIVFVMMMNDSPDDFSDGDNSSRDKHSVMMNDSPDDFSGEQ